MSELSAFLSIVGLILDAIGVVVIFLYALPKKFGTLDGAQELKPGKNGTLTPVYESEYRRRARVGLYLLLFGFFLQALGNAVVWLPIEWQGIVLNRGGNVMVGSVLEILSTVVLAGIAGYFMVGSPKNLTASWKGGCLALILALTITSVAAKFYQDKEMEEKLTGGDNYCYFKVARDDNKPDGYVTNLTNQTGTVPWFTFGVYHLPEENQKDLVWGWPPVQPCLKTTVNLRENLPQGNYQIDFMGSNRTWHQYLTISVTDDGNLSQTIRIEDDEGGIVRPETTESFRIKTQ